MKSLKIAILSVAMLVVSVVVVKASVIFDSETGEGFVGKGDVQTAFGWNNAQLQKNAGGVTFTYNKTDKYDVTCEWDTTTGGKDPKTIHHEVTNRKNSKVDAGVLFEARKNSQITGFNLNGFNNESNSQAIPAVGDSCPNGGDGIVTDVDSISSEGGLFVNYGGTSVLLQ